MSDHTDADFKAEYAKSNRTSCKLCKMNIAQDSLRLAIMVESPVFDGKVPNWYHPKCFWKHTKVTSHTLIHGVDALRRDDQQAIKEKIGSGDGAAPGSSTAGGYNDFSIEYAKSKCSTCRGCGNKIDKDEVRMSVKDYESQRAKMYRLQPRCYHLDCFNDNRDEIGFSSDLEPSKVPGYKTLQKDDKDMVLEKLGKGEERKAPAEAAGSSKSKKVNKGETAKKKALKKEQPKPRRPQQKPRPPKQKSRPLRTAHLH